MTKPADLVDRLLANGFQDVGPGDVMVRVDLDPARQTNAAATAGGRRDHRNGSPVSPGNAATQAARDVVTVLLDAFDVEEDRRAGVEQETQISLGHPHFHALPGPTGWPARRRGANARPSMG